MRWIDPALLLTLSFGAGACAVTPEPAQDQGLHWKTFQSPENRFRIDFPDVFAVHQEHGEVMFTYNGTPARVVVADAEAARDRGLWITSEPVANVELSGRVGKKYIYNHWDGPVYARTIAYVIPFRDHFLALEFRTADELTSVQRRMLASFELESGS